ncbi:4Fe-4S binding protein [Lancefieldella sp. Marseille-Q7238]|uniref:4Fe-4S binding protein n=1 Tax=Lancefieldella sp. Marseille-Q7238 TaxID=3022127 RepID=UPI0032C042F2
MSRRGVVQACAAFLTNPHIPNFIKGTIYTGSAKSVCVPGLNCYSCPAATGACPIGAFQAVVGSSKFSFSYYITGILILIGTLLGRFVCGFLCPFGWVQDLLNKIPFPKKFGTKKLKWLRYLKYVILIVMVWALPALLQNAVGMGDPYFCKYICPQGILEGAIPLSLADESIKAALGTLFTMKFSILATIVLLSVMFYRPFCKWICPLGAFYSLFNRISILQYRVDTDACIKCGKCARTCKMDVDITKNNAALECIRCGECIKACPVHAIDSKLMLMNREIAASKKVAAAKTAAAKAARSTKTAAARSTAAKASKQKAAAKAAR